ncbi:MAG: hypothetical protein ACJAZS_000458 [Alteromonas naphthalenivorans]|jgi:hypothetical protein
MNKILLLFLLISFFSINTASPKKSLRIQILKKEAEKTQKELAIIAKEEAQAPRDPHYPQYLFGYPIPKPHHGFRKQINRYGQIMKHIKRTSTDVIAKFAHNHSDTPLICTHHTPDQKMHCYDKSDRAVPLVLCWQDSQGFLVFEKPGAPSDFLAFPLTGTNTQLADEPKEHTHEVKDGFIVIKIPIKH